MVIFSTVQPNTTAEDSNMEVDDGSGISTER
jgi:hypothetical protein